MPAEATKSAHTPGPWVVDAYQCVTPGLVADSLAIWPKTVHRNQRGTPVALVTPMEKANKTDRANARLIAAAPTMFSAINEAIDHCEQCRYLGRESLSRCARCQTFAGIIRTIEGR